MSKHLFILKMLLFILCSCSSDYDATSTDDISFGAHLSITTRAPIESDENNIPTVNVNQIQILRGVDGPIGQASFNTIGNIEITGNMLAGTDYITVQPRQIFRADKKDAHFMAFHPKPTTFSHGCASYTINGEQDIMVADTRTAQYNNPIINFSFTHKLARIEIHLQAKHEDAIERFGNLIAASINIPNELELLINADGSSLFRKKDDSSIHTLEFGSLPLTMAGNTTNKGYMIYPEKNDLNITLQFEHRQIQEYKIQGFPMEAGKSSIINLYVDAYGISFSVKVKDWEEGNGSGSEIIID